MSDRPDICVGCRNPADPATWFNGHGPLCQACARAVGAVKRQFAPAYQQECAACGVRMDAHGDCDCPPELVVVKPEEAPDGA